VDGPLTASETLPAGEIASPADIVDAERPPRRSLERGSNILQMDMEPPNEGRIAASGRVAEMIASAVGGDPKDSQGSRFLAPGDAGAAL
jgi:hypothetical protein